MSAGSRRPAIVGAAQFTQRLEDPREALEPVALMERALRDAAHDAGAPGLLESLDAIHVPQGMWKYGDPGRILAERVGASSAKTAIGALSGHIPQVMLDRACAEIAAGRCDVVALVGGESEHSRRSLQRREIPLHWDEATPGEPDERIGSSRPTFPKQELRAGILKASMIFGLCQTALRRECGETPAVHRVRISELASRLSSAAAKNPYAWIDRHVDAEEIRTPTPANRMVTYPYTKLMTANIAVDQSAAIIVCSREAARRHGIPEDRSVHLRVATEMSHDSALSHRQALHHHEGMVIAAQRALELADIDAGDVAHIDLYSCFPFAVQASAAALGLAETHPLTLTGGLTFSGGPLGNYVVQAMAALVARLRDDPGSLGLVGSIGGSFAKFGYGIFSTDEGNLPGPLIEDVSAEYAVLPTRESPEEYSGPAVVESYVVDVFHNGHAIATFSALTDSGDRVWGRSEDAALTEALLRDEEACGHPARLDAGTIDLR
jgi:acetyl-CoA C-acetyltransferase